MKQLAQALLAFTLSLAVILVGCASTKTVWPNTVKCATPITGALVQEVEAILNAGDGVNISDAAIAALEKLAKENGPELVACIVEQFINNWMQPSGTAAPRPKAAAAARAQDFLNRKGVTVSTPTGS